MSAKSTAAAGLESLVNRFLRLDPELVEGVAELEGKVLELHVRGIDQRFQIFPRNEGVGVVLVEHGDAQPVVEADVAVSGPPFTLLRLLGSWESLGGALPSDVSVRGDLELIQKLAGLAKRAEIDWEEWLSKLAGDSVAHEVGRGVRGIVTWARSASETFAYDIAEYLREERRLSPTRLEVEDFATDVDTTRDDVERLAIRIARLGQAWPDRPGVAGSSKH